MAGRRCPACQQYGLEDLTGKMIPSAQQLRVIFCRYNIHNAANFAFIILAISIHVWYIIFRYNSRLYLYHYQADPANWRVSMTPRKCGAFYVEKGEGEDTWSRRNTSEGRCYFENTANTCRLHFG